MAVQEKNVIRIRSAMSVSSLCRLLKMSRSQFYLHVSRGTFHTPLRLTTTGRPYFTASMAEEIITARETGIGCNGEYVLFYERLSQSPKPSKKKPSPNHAELIESLEELGLRDLTNEKVEAALASTFPGGVVEEEPGNVLRRLFVTLKRSGSA